MLKAVALGARGTLIGRAFLYGLGAMGEAGVTSALEIIHKELDLTMAFCGRTRHRRRSTEHPAAGHLPGLSLATDQDKVGFRPQTAATRLWLISHPGPA